MRGQNPAVLDVELLNPYNGIDALPKRASLDSQCFRPALRRGVFVDAIYDIGRIENVHFNPWWSMKPRCSIGSSSMARRSSSGEPTGNTC